MPGEFTVLFRFKDSARFDLGEAVRRLALEQAKIGWKYGMAGFVGPDYSFCIYYGRRPGRLVIA